MLQNIRDNSQGVVAKIIVGLIICTFALFGIESIVSLGGGEDAPATVNGEEISELEVAQMVDLQKRRFQAQFGENFDPSFLNDKMLRSSAIESLIEEKALSQAASESGVYFSDMAIDKIILSSPEFQEAGQFDANRFDLILRNAGFTRSTYREMLRSNLLLAQGRSAWQGTSFATESEAKTVSSLKGQTRDIAYVEFSLEDVKSKITLTDEEISAYYADNESRFMSDEKVSVDYVELDQAILAGDVIVDEDEIKARYEDTVAEANAKKEYRVAHILILGDDDASKAKATEALAKIDTQSFDDVAKEYSDDDSSKFSGGDLGFADLSVYEPEFAAAVEVLQEGETSSLVQTRDGQHIIKLLETRQPEVASFADLKDSIEEELKQDKASAAYIEKLEILKDEAFSADKLDSVASALDLTIKSTAKFSRAGGAGFASERAVVQAAFAENVLFEGSNSEVIEIGNGKAVVVHLKEHEESAVKPLDSVKEQIKVLLTNERAKEQLAQITEESLGKAKDSALTDWKEVKGLARDSRDLDPKLMTKAFALAYVEGEVTYSSVETATGTAIVRLDGVTNLEEVVATQEEQEGIQFNASRNEFGAYKKYQLENADVDRS